MIEFRNDMFYSHVNYSVTKIITVYPLIYYWFYSHVNYSVTKILTSVIRTSASVLQSRKLFSY